MCYNSRRYPVPFLNLGRLQEKTAWLDESQFQWKHTDGKVNVWYQQYESLNPVHPVDSQMWWRCCNGVRNYFLEHIGLLILTEHYLYVTAYSSNVAEHA